jgi:hypothetical protein
MTAAPPARSDAPWDLSFLRVGTAVAAAVTAVAVPVTGLVAGWPHALGVLVGAAIVTAFFCLSGVVVAWAGRINDTFTLPAALGTFGIKALVLFALLTALPEHGWLARLTVAWTVVVGALLWSAIQLRWVWTRQLYYVPPPAPPSQATVRPSPATVRPSPDGPQAADREMPPTHG